jgi:hypothetical protein
MMSLNEWVKKYIPHGDGKKVLQRAGYTEGVLQGWRHGVKPNTTTVIFISKTISLLYGHDYKTVVMEGILAAARLTHE